MPGPESRTLMTASPSRQSSATSTPRCELHCVVDQIGNCLKKKIAVTAHSRLIQRFDPKCDTLIVGDRVIEIAHFAHQRGKLDLAKPFSPSTLLDFRNAQECSDCSHRLVETGNRLIGNCSEFFQR